LQFPLSIVKVTSSLVAQHTAEDLWTRARQQIPMRSRETSGDAMVRCFEETDDFPSENRDFIYHPLASISLRLQTFSKLLGKLITTQFKRFFLIIQKYLKMRGFKR